MTAPAMIMLKDGESKAAERPLGWREVEEESMQHQLVIGHAHNNLDLINLSSPYVSG